MQPTDYALGLLFAAWLDLAGWGFIIYGAGMVLGGLVAIVYIIVTWGGVTLGPDPVFPPPPAPARHAAREPALWAPLDLYRDDADTHVIPRIPGATPELEAFTEAIEQAEEQLSALAAFAAIPGLRVIESPDLGPVCPICGAPFHAVCPNAPKSAPKEPDPLDVTQDITVPYAEPAPAYQETFGKHPRAELGTQELSGSVARAKESAA